MRYLLPRLLALGLFCAGCANIPTSSTFDVKAYGATGDGKTIDTDAINKAIDAASAAGGGTVLFPAGTYASYSIHLKSNVALYLGEGATLLAADPLPERPAATTRPSRMRSKRIRTSATRIGTTA